jgi:hypothetical protein
VTFVMCRGTVAHLYVPGRAAAYFYVSNRCPAGVVGVLSDEWHGCKSDGLMDASEVLGVSSSPLLTVDEATRVLRIGRSLGYQLAHDYEATSVA